MAQLVGSNSLGLGKLIDGKNQFVHIMYSANVDGSNMTADIQADTKYIGIVTSNSETAPTNPSDYSWGRFVGTSGTSSYTWLRYSPNEDGSNMTANPTPETKYIGVAITADNNAPTDYTKYSWALIKGDDGRGISKTEVTYQKSTSGTVIPTGTWVTTIPTVNAGEYLWTRTLFTYTDNTTSSTYSVARSGVTGLGISRSDVDYQKSTSGTVAPTGAWTATIPTVAANEYLWTRTTLTYTNATTSVSYSVGKMGADGKDAQLLYLTASSQIQAFDKDDKPKTTQAITISAKLQNASGTATFVAIPYIGNVAQTAITLGGTGNDRTLLPSQWTNTQWTTIAITATLGSLTDTISVIKVKDGATGPKGDVGNQGIPGEKGEDGRTPYTHWAYAWSADGKDRFTTTYPNENIILNSQFKNGTTGWLTGNASVEVDTTNKLDGLNSMKVGLNADSTAGTASRAFYRYNGETGLVPSSGSLWLKADKNVKIGIRTDGGSKTASYNVTTEWQRFEIPKDGYMVLIWAFSSCVLWVAKPKVENSSVATIYTPAPSEDFTNAYPTFAGTYIDYEPMDSEDPTKYTWQRILGETGDKGEQGESASSYWITPSVDAVKISAAKVLSPSTITFSAYSKTGEKDSALYSGRFNIFTSTDGIIYTSRYTSTVNQSSYTYTIPSGVKFIKAKLFKSGGFSVNLAEQTIPILESAEDLEISGNNMIIDSTNMLQSKVAFSGATGTKTLVDEAKSPTGKATKIRLSANTSTILFYFANGRNLADPINKTLLKGEIYTLSMMIRADVEFASNGVTINEAEVISHTFTQVTTEYKRVSVTFKPTVNSSTATNQNIHFFANDLVTTVGNDIYIHSLQLEKGNIATSWTPAPEDAKLYTAWSNDPNGKDMVRVYPNENLLVRKDELVQRIIDASGNIVEYAGNNTSAVPIPVTAGETLYFSQSQTPTSTVCFRWRWLDANMKYISRAADASNKNFTVAVPSGASYLQVSYSASWDSKIERNGYTTMTPSPADNPVKAEMAYIGYSPKDSNDPKDYVWIENPKAVSLYTAWSNKEDGSEDFARNYPTPNLLFDSKLTNLSNWSVNSYLNGVSNGDGTATLNKTETTTSRSFFSSATKYNPEAKSSTMYSFAIDIKFDSNCTGIAGSSVFLRETKNGSNLRDFASVSLTDSVEKGKWVTYIASGTTSSDIDTVQFTLAMANGMLGTFHVRKPKVTFGSTALPFSVMATDDPIKAEMAYIGYSPKDSNNPADYVWSENPKAKGTFKRWSNDPNGLVDMTDVYPNENLLEDSISMSGFTSGTLTENAYLDTFNSRKNTKTIATQSGNVVTVGQKIITELLEPSTTYTVSFVARGNLMRTYVYPSLNAKATGSQGQSTTSADTPMDWTLSSNWQEYTYTFTTLPSLTGTKYLLFRLDNNSIDTNAEVARVKLEKSSSKTIYTSNQAENLLLSIPQYVGIGSKDTMNPADFVWNINPEYNQARTDLGLDSKVDDETFNDAQDHMNEVVDGKADAQELQDLKDMADNLQQSYEGFVGEGGKHEADLQALQARVEGLIFELGEQVAAFDFVKTHMRLGEEGFEIAEEGSTMKMLLSNNALSFIDGGKEVASFSNQKFIINQGAIVESLQVGSHKMSRLSDKVTVFQYAPKTTVTN